MVQSSLPPAARLTSSPASTACLHSSNSVMVDSGGRPLYQQFRQPQPALTLYTDASLTGWGAHCSDLRTQGVWQGHETSRHINYLELLEVFKALWSSENILQDRVVQIALNNVVTVFYINKQGSTKSAPLAYLALCLWDWCIPIGITPLAVHLARTDNEEANSLSRRMLTTHEWELDRQFCQYLFQLWGPPDKDYIRKEKIFRRHQVKQMFLDPLAAPENLFSANPTVFSIAAIGFVLDKSTLASSNFIVFKNSKRKRSKSKQHHRGKDMKDKDDGAEKVSLESQELSGSHLDGCDKDTFLSNPTSEKSKIISQDEKSLEYREETKPEIV
ncbi:Arginine repressor, partial [Varanus komodoensis]